MVVCARRERLARHLAAAEHFAAGRRGAGRGGRHALPRGPPPRPDEPSARIFRPGPVPALEAAAARRAAIGAYASAAALPGRRRRARRGRDERLRLPRGSLAELYDANDVVATEAEARDAGRGRPDHGRAGPRRAGGVRPGRCASRPMRDPPTPWPRSPVSVPRSGDFAMEDPDGLRLSAELTRCPPDERRAGPAARAHRGDAARSPSGSVSATSSPSSCRARAGRSRPRGGRSRPWPSTAARSPSRCATAASGPRCAPG